MSSDLSITLQGIFLLKSFACCIIFMHLLSSADFNFFFLNKHFQKFFQKTFRMSNGFDPDQDQRSVGPDLDSNCL